LNFNIEVLINSGFSDYRDYVLLCIFIWRRLLWNN